MADPATTSNEELELFPCGPEDRDLQVRLFNRCFDKKVERSDLEWRYDRSPSGRSVGVILRAPDGQPVCGFSYSPRTFLPFGDEAAGAPCGQQGDVMTDPDWRKRGIASRVWGHCEAETRRQGWPMNWGYPNRRSASVFRKLGWRTVGVIRPLSLFLRNDAAAKAERFRDGRLPALLLPFAVRRARARRRALLASAGDGWEARPLASFPEEVGELSRAVEPRFALMVRRDKAFLDWRFVHAPSRAHRPFGIYRAGRLAGYVVVQPPLEGGAVGWVVDLLAPESRDVAAALATGLGELERSSASVARATAVDGSWWASELEHAGFLAPKPDNHLFVYTFPLLDDHPVLRAANDASRWYLCDADRDDDPIG
jgi:GNAT superfamily N-acetyltransferase